MPQVNHVRKLGSIDFVSGGRRTMDLEKGDVLLELYLRLRYRITNAAGGPVGPLYQTLSRLIQRIEVLVGGRDNVISVAGASLAAMRSRENGIVEQGMDATVVLTNSAVTDYDINLSLPFYLPNGRRPDDTALDLRRVSSATLAVNWGPSDCSDHFTTPNGALISLVQLQVEGRYLNDAPADAVYLTRQLDFVNREVVANNAAMDIIMDRGSGLAYRSFHLETLADRIASVTVLNAARLEAGARQFGNRDAPQILADNRRVSKLAAVAGNYHFDLSTFGQAVTWIPTDALPADLKLILDVTKQGTSCFANVTREAVRPLKIA